MIVLGIDPGISLVGWGIIEALSRDKFNFIQYGCIRTMSHLLLTERLYNIYTELQFIINKYNPEAVAVEELFFSKTAKSIAAVGHSRGAIILTISMNKLPFFEYNPRLVKMALTGYGVASKYQVQYMVKTFLKLKKIPKPDDAADALAIAICHINTIKWNKTVNKYEIK
jgi:crossover junction endodeoxyribonuclease RuvC